MPSFSSPGSPIPATTFGFTSQATRHYNGRVRIPALHAAILLACSIFLPPLALASDATWGLSPTSNDWGTADNWTPSMVPTGTATFDISNTTHLSVAEDRSVDSLVFNPGASAFTIKTEPALHRSAVTFSITGAGFINNSGITQNIILGTATALKESSIVFQGLRQPEAPRDLRPRETRAVNISGVASLRLPRARVRAMARLRAKALRSLAPQAA